MVNLNTRNFALGTAPPRVELPSPFLKLCRDRPVSSPDSTFTSREEHKPLPAPRATGSLSENCELRHNFEVCCAGVAETCEALSQRSRGLFPVSSPTSRRTAHAPPKRECNTRAPYSTPFSKLPADSSRSHLAVSLARCASRAS